MLIHHFEAETHGFQGLVDQNDRGNKGVKNMKNAFLKPLTMQLNMVWEPNSHISMLNMNQKFYICWRSGLRGPIPPLMMSRIDGKQFNSFAKYLQAQCKIYLYHKTFIFYDSCLSFLVWRLSFWYCIMIVANKLRGLVGRGLGRPQVGSIPPVSVFIPPVSHQES